MFSQVMRKDSFRTAKKTKVTITNTSLWRHHRKFFKTV